MLLAHAEGEVMNKNIKIKFKNGKIVNTYNGIHSCLKIVKVRKAHECCECKRIIKKGEQALFHKHHENPYAGVYGYLIEYWCNNCFEIIKEKEAKQ